MNAEVIGTWAGQVWNALNEYLFYLFQLQRVRKINCKRVEKSNETERKRIVCSPWLVGSRR